MQDTQPPDPFSLRLEILAKDTGQPVPLVEVWYRSWEGQAVPFQSLVTDQTGICDLSFPDSSKWVEVFTRLDGFADVRLRWQPERGDKIPNAYTLNLARAVPLGGRVVDPDGHPVARAKVSFSSYCRHDLPPIGQVESSNGLRVEAETDSEGRWQVARRAAETISDLGGHAQHPDFAHSANVLLSREPEAERQLRAGTHTFRLGRATTVRGTVLDTNHRPVSGAKVLVGEVHVADKKETTSLADGTFSIKGCGFGTSMVTAQAPGFSPVTELIDVAGDSRPFTLTLRSGKTLRLRVVNQAGGPVPNAHVFYQCQPRHRLQAGSLAPVQVIFHARTDADGQVLWEHAPERELKFHVHAKGYMQPPDITLSPQLTEHLITLVPALTISGTVEDAATGKPIPQFRIIAGYPSPIGPQWSPSERFWLRFVGGRFRHCFEEPVIHGAPNPGYHLKFEADGYAPFVSRRIAGEEGEVRLDIKLVPATGTLITVLNPDASPAALADVGLVTPGACLRLVPGGFSHFMVQTAGALLRTDQRGQVLIPPDDSVTRVVIASPLGYAQVTRTELTAHPNVQLQCWGKLEGTLTCNRQPQPLKALCFQMRDDFHSGLGGDFDADQVKTDDLGRFAFPQVPPGRHRLSAWVSSRYSPPPVTQHTPRGHIVITTHRDMPLPAGSDARHLVTLSEVDIHPGQTTHLDLDTAMLM